MKNSSNENYEKSHSHNIPPKSNASQNMSRQCHHTTSNWQSKQHQMRQLQHSNPRVVNNQQFLVPPHFQHAVDPNHSRQLQSNSCNNSSITTGSSSGYVSSLGSSNISQNKHGINLRATELAPLLREKIALLPGGRTRTGGPIICFPSNSKADQLPIEDLFVVVRYLTYLPEESARKFGFAVIIDMRSGTTWHSVKPILKVLEACVGDNVSMTFIIKPDKLMEKHKAQLAISKFSFDIQLVSIDTLFREIDPSQLTVELEGSLPYHHEEWIKIRCSLEDFFLCAQDMHEKFSHLHAFLDRKINPITVEEAKRSLEDHKSMRLKIFQAPIQTLELESERLTTWLRYGIQSSEGSGSGNQSLHSSNKSASGASFISSSWVSMNPDFQQLAPQVKQSVNKLYESRTALQQKWEAARTRLEQIYQLRLFEDDAMRMNSWLDQQRRVFLEEYVDIGNTASRAADLHAEHRQFLTNCTGVREQVTRLTGVAGMLADTGHFASQQILKQASQLEHEWKSFTVALEDRSRMLLLSTSFHARAESFLAQCRQWESAMRCVSGKNANELNHELSLLHDYWQEVQSSHGSVCGDGRLLANHLSAPVPNGSHNSLTAAVDYSQGRKHCTNLVHELWSWYKQLERVFIEQRRRITARLALFMFKEDVGQVLAWLTDHGEPFLQRQTAVGKSSQRAEQLYNAHMQFEQVAANTLTNAEKLISAADELAGQADDPEEILQEASELQRRITEFTRCVETRRETLDIACGFYTHTKEILHWLANLRHAHNPAEHLPLTIESMEEALNNFHRERSSLELTADRLTTEGDTLLKRLVEAEEVAHLQSLLSQVSGERSSVMGLLMERQVRLDLCMQLRFFEADVHLALERLAHDIPSLPKGDAHAAIDAAQHKSKQKHYEWLADPKKAPDIASLEEVASICLSALPSVEEVLTKGSELARAFESVGVNFPAGEPPPGDGVLRNGSSENAVDRVNRLMTELSVSVAAVDDLNERLAGELDWRRLQINSRQVLQWINECECLLYQNAKIPTSLADAESLQAEHDKFQPVLNEAHPNAVQCAARASYLLQQASQQSKDAQPEHPRKADFQHVVETVASRWQKLVYAAEEKHKLLVAATNWYKTSAQVTSVLRQLEKEYRREEDCCQADKVKNESSKVISSYLKGLADKHGEQKEAFVKACILARRTAELFIKYLHRQPSHNSGRVNVEESIKKTMTELMNKEQSVLEVWAARKRRLDECMQYVKLTDELERLLMKICESVGCSVSTPKPLNGDSQLLNELKRIMSIVETFGRSSAMHVKFLDDYWLKLQKFIPQPPASDLNKSTAPVSPDAKSLDNDIKSMQSPRSSDINLSISSVGSGSTSGIGSMVSASSTTSTVCSTGDAVLTQEQSRILHRRANLIKELIGTEKAYVESLRQCMDHYHKAFNDTTNDSAIQYVGRTTRRFIKRRNEHLKVRSDIEEDEEAKEEVVDKEDTSKISDHLLPPSGLLGKSAIIFSNLPNILKFHQDNFEPELAKYATGGDFLPEDVGHCFVSHADKLAELYVNYCVSNVDSTDLLIAEGGKYFQQLQGQLNVPEPLQSYLIKPVQRITKYQLILKELKECCDPNTVGELNEGLETMLAVPKKANDALHTSMLQGLADDIPSNALGDVILQEHFTVWEPKNLIKKAKERRLFLFDFCLILAKEIPSLPGEHRGKYQYKTHLMLAEFNITEHVEGDECKIALWNGRVPQINEYRLVMKAQNMDIKQNWVRAMRESKRERMFSMQSLLEQQNSMTSLKSQGSVDDTEQTLETYFILENYQSSGQHELSVSAHQIVQLLHKCDKVKPPASLDPSKYNPRGMGQWAYVRVVIAAQSMRASTTTAASTTTSEGFIPTRIIGAPTGKRSTSQGPSRRASASVRKWLPAGVAGLRERKQSSSGPINLPLASMRRNSKSDVPVSEPMKIAASGDEILTSTVLDNVSEESVDVELPPPMMELPALPKTMPEAEPSAEENDFAAGTAELPNGMEQPQHLMEQLSSVHLSSPTEASLNGNPDLSTQRKPAFEPVPLGINVDYEKYTNVQLSPSNDANNDEAVGKGKGLFEESACDSVGCVPSIIGLPAGFCLGDVRLHDTFEVATHFIVSARQQASRLPTADHRREATLCLEGTGEFHTEEELHIALLHALSDSQCALNFSRRCLLLYDNAIVIGEPMGSGNPDTDEGDKGGVYYKFKNFIHISQLSVLEDVNASGKARPSGDQIFWFCLTERPLSGKQSGQSQLCHVIAPRSADLRIRWLTEITAAVRAEKWNLSEPTLPITPQSEASSPNSTLIRQMKS